MNKQKWILSLIALLMMGGAAGALTRLKANQKLGMPGVKIQHAADGKGMEVYLPEYVLDYKSEKIEPEKIVLDVLPKDTTFGQRRYTAPDGFWAQVNVVLMGSDRTSIHKPQFCLEGAGWKIDASASREEIIPMEKPEAYDLHVTKLVATKQIINEGQTITARGVYVYWFAADHALLADPIGIHRAIWSARKLLQSGELQRWAYISYFSVCLPGQEEATFERVKSLIAASVPEFQLPPDSDGQTAVVRPE